MCDQNINLDKQKKRSKWLQLIFLALITGILVFRVFIDCKYYTNIGDGLARLVGGIIGVQILSLGVWKWFFKKKKGHLLGCFSVILLLGSFVNVSKKIPEIAQTSRAKKELSKIFLSSSDNTLKDDYCSPESQDIAYGKLAPLLTFLKTQTNLDQKDYATVNSETEKTCDLLSDYKDLANVNKLIKAVKYTEKALETLDKSALSVLQRYNNRPQEIQKLKIDKEYKKQVLIGYYEQTEKNKAHLVKIFNLWKGQLAESKCYYEFLLKKRGLYTVKDNLLIFTKDEDAFRNNLYLITVEKFKNRIQELSNQYDQNMKELIDSI